MTIKNPHAIQQFEFLNQIDKTMAAISSVKWPMENWNLVTASKPNIDKRNLGDVDPSKKGHQNTEEQSNPIQPTLTLHPDELNRMLNRRKAIMVIVCPTTDLFHKDVPDEFIDQVFKVILLTTGNIYQIITKRSKRMAKYFSSRSCPKNVWLGVIVENRTKGLRRLDNLREIKCLTKIVSMEPLLEDLGRVDLTGFDWIVVSGGSGPNVRPLQKSWVERVQRQAARAHVPFYFKQWGAFGSDGIRRSTKDNGRLLNGQTHNGYPITTIYWNDTSGEKKLWNRSNGDT